MEIHKQILFCFFIVLGCASGAAEEGAKTDYSPSEKEYRSKTQKLNSLETKVGELETRFQALVKTKSEARDKDTKLVLIEQMKTVKKEIDEAADKYNELRDEVRFKFPDKGRALVKRYAPMQKKTMQQLEKRSTLDTDLTKAKKAAEKAYRPFIRRAEEEERKKILEQEKVQKASVKTLDNSGGRRPRIRLEK